MSYGNIDSLSINTIRALAADTVRKANSGHPGAPMGCAPMAHVLFTRFLNANPKNINWFNRDRFVLSNGHACVLQYVMLHLLGYKVTIDDLKSFRQLNSVTPGHPENHATDGIEVTTGPLGQGIANAVGIAIAEAQLAATFNKPCYEIVDNYTYVILGDGCMQEGVSSEASSLAGHLKLGKLIALYDDNHIQIDGDTALGFTEDVVKRYESYGWHVIIVGDGDTDLKGIHDALEAAKAVKDKPSLIKIRTTIGYGSKKEGTESVHGSPLAPEDIVQIKSKFGFNPEEKFFVPKEVRDFYHSRVEHGAKLEADWNALFEKYSRDYPTEAAELKRRLEGKLPDGWEKALPRYTPSDPAVATRKLSENVFNKIFDVIPELIGGSADLTGSNLTRWKDAVDFQHPSTGLGTYSGRYLRYGVREHAMSSIMNGMASYGGLIPYSGTFFNFITYAWGAVRLSALSNFRVIYVMTHDSIGLGEDGPTHQPIETAAICRALPNLITLRPADGNETSGAYLVALRNEHRPSVLALSRQNVPHLEGSSVEAVLKGAYVIQDVPKPEAIIVSTGTEVSLALDAAKLLKEQGVCVRVVSMPSQELFDEQPIEYRRSVFTVGVPTVSVEVYSALGWQKYSHYQIALNEFGASGPAKDVYKRFGFVPDVVAAKVQKVVNHYKGKAAPELQTVFELDI